MQSKIFNLAVVTLFLSPGVYGDGPKKVESDLSLSISRRFTAKSQTRLKSYGGEGYEEGHAIVQLEDGNFIAVGETSSPGGDGDVKRNHSKNDDENDDETADFWILKLSLSGKIIKQFSLGGTKDDRAFGVAKTRSGNGTFDGGYVVVGMSNSNDGDLNGDQELSGHHGSTKTSDYWVVKFNRRDQIERTRSIGGKGSDEATSIAATPDGGFIVGGNSQSKDGDVKDHLCARDFWIVKLDRNGNVQWTRSLGGTSNDYLIEILSTKNGGYVATGRTESDDGDVAKNHGTYDFWVVKLAPWNGVRNQAPEIEWQNSYGDWDWEWGNSIIETWDGNFVVAGYTYTFEPSEGGQVQGHHGEFDYWVVKIDGQNNGKLLWQKSLGGSNYELGYGIVETTDHGYALVGGSPSTDGQVIGFDGKPDNHGEWDAWLVKLDANGKYEWGKSLGGSRYDAAYSIVETVEEVNGSKMPKLVILGETRSNDKDIAGKNHCIGDSCDDDIWLVKLSGI
jgi:hypothetical protein